HQATTFRPDTGPAAAPLEAVDDLVAVLVAESTRAAADLVAITESVTGLSATLPELQTPDPEELDGIARGDVDVDLSSVAVDAGLTNGAAACPTVRILGVQIACLLTRPADDPLPVAEVEAIAAQAAEATAKAQGGAADTAGDIVTEAMEAGGAVPTTRPPG
ncbi:MAG: hypothetical protein ACRD0S_10120, partial [Acidimicrobiales bacterium]